MNENLQMTLSQWGSRSNSKEKKSFCPDIDSDQEFEVQSVDSIFKSKESSMERKTILNKTLDVVQENQFFNTLSSIKNVKTLDDLIKSILGIKI